MLTFLPGWFTGLCSGWLILCRHVSASHLTLALTSAAATDSLSHVMMISIKLFQFTFPRGKPGTGGGFYHKMSIKTRKQVRLKEILVRSAARTPRYWRPRTPEASGRGQEMRQTQPLASPLSVQLLWEEGGVTISHYNTHIPFPDFMPAHPRHKLQCSLQRP